MFKITCWSMNLKMSKYRALQIRTLQELGVLTIFIYYTIEYSVVAYAIYVNSYTNILTKWHIVRIFLRQELSGLYAYIYFLNKGSGFSSSNIFKIMLLTLIFKIGAILWAKSTLCMPYNVLTEFFLFMMIPPLFFGQKNLMCIFPNELKMKK